MIHKIESQITDKSFEKDLIQPHIIFLLNKIKIYLNKLRDNNRVKRSIDWLGSAWKWLAETPDARDMQIVVINNNQTSNHQSRNG